MPSILLSYLTCFDRYLDADIGHNVECILAGEFMKKYSVGTARIEFPDKFNKAFQAPQKDVNESNKNYSCNHLCFQTNCVSVGALLANYGVHRQEGRQ